MTRLRLALFDVDGTLMDSQGHIVQAMATAFAGEGLAPPVREAVLRIVGLSLPDAIARLAPPVDAPTLNRLVEGYKATYDDRGRAGDVPPLYPGALACLDALAADPHVLLGVATGKSRRGLTHVLEGHGLTERFLTTQVADDHPSKPHPAMVHAALRETGVAAGDAGMIGDTSFDMEMALAAGVRRLGVAWGYHTVAAILAAAAHALPTEIAQVPVHLAQLWDAAA